MPGTTTNGAGPDGLAIQWGEYLASLPADERKQALHTAKHTFSMAIPEEEAGKPPIRTAAEYLATPIPVPPVLVEPRIVLRGGITAMISRGGKGKTAVSLNRVVRWAGGLPMFDELPDWMAPTQPLRTLIIENEGAPGLFQEALQKVFDGQGFTPEQRELAERNVLIWGEGGAPRIKLDADGTLDQVQRGLAEYEPDLLFMEPFRTLWSGEENDSGAMGHLLDKIAELTTTYNAGALLTHHERKSSPDVGGDQMDAARGSTVLEGEAAVMERWVRVNGATSELRCIKSRYGREPAPVRMTWQRERWGYALIDKDAEQRALYQLLVDNEGLPMTVAEVAAEREDKQDHVRYVLNKLAEDRDDVEVMASTSAYGGGSTGKRYRVVLADDEGELGL